MSQTSDDAIVTGIVDIVARVLGIPREQISVDATFRDTLRIDSFGMIEVVLEIESRFTTSIPDDEIGRFAEYSIVEAADRIRNAT